MRILAVTPYYPPEGGGLERYAQAVLERLARSHEVRVVATTRADAAPLAQIPLSPVHGRSPAHPPGSTHEATDHVQQVHEAAAGNLALERRRVPFHLGNAPIDPRLTSRLRRTITEFRPDVVVGHAPVPFPAEAAARAARREGVPFVLTYHSGRLRGSSIPLEAMAFVARATTQRRLFASSRRIVAVSPFVRDNALASHADRVTVIPPGVDGRYQPGPHVDEEEMLFVGPLSNNYRWKGIDVLWQAFTAMRSQGVAARLRLVGSGDRFEEFRRLARKRDDVQVDGRLSEEELLAAYQRAGLVALPSTGDAEAFGMVLAEANACGRPVVASAVGGIPDYVRHGQNGLLARPGDAEDLAAKLTALLQDPHSMSRMGATGRRKVLMEHDWDELSGQTERVLEAALFEGRPRR